MTIQAENENTEVKPRLIDAWQKWSLRKFRTLCSRLLCHSIATFSHTSFSFALLDKPCFRKHCVGSVVYENEVKRERWVTIATWT